MPAWMAGLLGLLGGVGGAALLFYVLRSRVGAERSRALDEARREADRITREAEDRARDEESRRRDEQSRQVEQQREEWRAEERRLARRESESDARAAELERRERELREAGERHERERVDLDALREEREHELSRAKEDLLRIGGLSAEEARAEALARFEEDAAEEIAASLRRRIEHVESEADARAQKVLAHSLQRLAVTYAIESTTATVTLPNEDMKGRVIGREGRNIRAIEKATGVDVIIDDTPGVVVVSCFDHIRRETARRSLERLVEDGRIHPARIEEVVEGTRQEIEEDIRLTARKVLHELEIARVDPRLEYCVGRLKYRTSYGQNQLQHAVEVAYIASMIAAEMGVDKDLARRCGLLHDVGKAIDHEMHGGHPEIGADLLRRCNERSEVVNTAAAHHGDEPFESVYAVIAQVADSISAARPGARRDTMEKYIRRLEQLEEIASSYQDVESAYAIQAGREVRVLVDAAKMDDAASLVRAREIARRIEDELQYPGEVKVTIIREARVTEYAR